MASLLLISPSLLPPLSCLSYSASARKPLGFQEADCGVKLPNSSFPFSIVPLPLRSNASHESSEYAVVHETPSGIPLLLRSKRTPPGLPVKRMPLPAMSIRMGEAGGLHCASPLESRCFSEELRQKYVGQRLSQYFHSSYGNHIIGLIIGKHSINPYTLERTR